VPYLYRLKYLQRRFEVAYRNLTNIQFEWEGGFPVRVEDDPHAPYDYHRPADAVQAHLDYAEDLLSYGLYSPAIPEVTEVLRREPANVRALLLAARIAEEGENNPSKARHFRRQARLAHLQQH